MNPPCLSYYNRIPKIAHFSFVSLCINLRGFRLDTTSNNALSITWRLWLTLPLKKEMVNEKEGDENKGSKIESWREINLDRDIGRQKARLWKRTGKERQTRRIRAREREKKERLGAKENWEIRFNEWQEDKEIEIEGLREKKVKKKLRLREIVKDRKLEGNLIRGIQKARMRERINRRGR